MSRSQSQARPLPPPDNKAKQDVSYGSKPGKPPGGGGRGRGRGRREPQHTSAVPRRPPPQRGGRGGGNKQPPGRGYCPPAAVTEADEIEVGSLYKSGSKKQSLNHLLSFQYTPRGIAPEGGRRGRADNRGAKHFKKPVYRQTYSKEQYLQANCRFTVTSLEDYTVHTVDPDIPVLWDHIEEVHLPSSGTEPLNCPICLFPPIAGKISKCGHVFCWSCILHYLALSDSNWRKCPICYDDIHRADLKSVQVYHQINVATGSVIEMRLMKRDRNSLWSVPVNHPGIEDLPGLEDSEVNKSLSKLVKATPAQVMESILERERRELETQLREDQEEPEAVFIKEALTLLESRMDKYIELSSIPAVKKRPTPKSSSGDSSASLLPPIEALKISEVSKMEDPFLPKQEDKLEDVATDERDETETGSRKSSESEASAEDDTVDAGVTAADLDISAIQPVNQGGHRQQPKSTFYFYQDAGGQLIFLHALNVQMLVKEFGSLELCPETIKAVILEKDSSIMSEDLRHRTRYLGHLPVSSAFEVAELDLSSVVSKQTFNIFKDQLETRKRKRQRKRKNEKVREKNIRREEMRIMGRFPSPMARIESSYHYPRIGGSPVESLGSPHRRASSSDSQGSNGGLLAEAAGSTAASNAAWTAAPTSAAWPSTGTSGGTLNFASITKKAPTAAVVATPPKLTPVQGSGGMVKLGGKLPMARRRHDSDSEPEPEGYVPPPKAASIGDALAMALAQADSQPSGKKKGKKSRGTPILLTGGGPRP